MYIKIYVSVIANSLVTHFIIVLVRKIWFLLHFLTLYATETGSVVSGVKFIIDWTLFRPFLTSETLEISPERHPKHGDFIADRKHFKTIGRIELGFVRNFFVFSIR